MHLRSASRWALLLEKTHSWPTLMASVLTGEAARCAVIGFPSVSWHLIVRVARKRYHRPCTLQAQGRMHVQMKVRDARASP